jgi:signal peptidase I
MNNIRKPQAPGQTPKKSAFRQYAESIVIALVVALFVRTFVVQAFKIPSGSMENTLAIGDHLLVNKFIYGTKVPFTGKRIMEVRDPRRGDIIVFRYPMDLDKDFIKRVIGTPRDTVEIKDKKVFINGIPYATGREIYKDKGDLSEEQAPRDNFGPVTVPAGSYFVMGDNRDNSYDSRFWGFVPRGNILGEAFIKYWSWDGNEDRVRWGSIGQLIR